MVAGLSRHINGNDILLVGNKVDLLPKSVNKTKLKMCIRDSYNTYCRISWDFGVFRNPLCQNPRAGESE